MKRLHFRRQRMHQAAHPAHAGERHDEEDHAKRHEDGGLQKIGNHHGPQAAQHAVENNERARAENGPGHRKTAGRRYEKAKPKQSAGAGKQLEHDRGPGKNLMSSGVEAAREIFHHGGDTAASPALGEDEVAEQKTQGVSDIESNGRDTRAIGDAGGSGEGPGTEAGHKTTEAGDQPGNAAPATKIFGRAPVEAQNVEAHPHHQERVEGDDHVVHGVRACHRKARLPYTLFCDEIEAKKQQKERNSRYSNAILGPAMSRPSLLISAGEELFASFFSRVEQQRLSRLFRWERYATSKFTADLRRRLSTIEALVTTWDSPHLGDDLPLLAPQLRIIAHCGGEVK